MKTEGAGRPARKRQQFHYSFLKVLSGSDLSRRRLPVMRAQADAPGPSVWLTACAHGDEVGGVVTIQEVFKRLRKSPLLRGTLNAFPLMNPIGFEARSRNITLSREDLNRSFPGDTGGTLAERIAHAIFSRIEQTRPSLVLDLHNDWVHSVPYCLLDPIPGPKHRGAHRRAREFARRSGFLIVGEVRDSPESLGWESTLSGSLLSRDIPALTLELGEANVVNEKNVALGVASIWNVLAGLGMVEAGGDPFEYPVPAAYRGRVLGYASRPLSSSTGIVRFLARPGDTVVAGQPVARIVNAFGKLQETVRAERAGLVLGNTDFSVSYPGAAVTAFAVLEDAVQ